jgi:hypothetical protein
MFGGSPFHYRQTKKQAIRKAQLACACSVPRRIFRGDSIFAKITCVIILKALYFPDAARADFPIP